MTIAPCELVPSAQHRNQFSDWSAYVWMQLQNMQSRSVRDCHGAVIVWGMVFLLVAVGAYAAASEEQKYPRKLIRLVVPYAAGGGADITARALGQKLSESLQQPVIVDNRPGGGGRTAPDFVARSTPDGYTLLLATSSTLVFLPAMYRQLSYNPLTDFAHIAPFASANSVLLLHPSVPARSVEELIALAKARPGRLNYASTGVGTPAHLAAELLNYEAKINTAQIPYNGAGPGIIATMSGETDLIFSNILPAIAPIKSGKLRALAVTSLQRSSVLPNLPTVAESGLPGFDVSIFFSLVSPVDTPKDVISRLFLEISKAAQSKELRERLAKDGAESMSVSAPEEFTSIISVQLEKWSKVIKRANIRIE